MKKPSTQGSDEYESSSESSSEEEDFTLQAKALKNWDAIVCRTRLLEDIYSDYRKLISQTKDKFSISQGRALLFLSNNNYKACQLSFISDEKLLNEIFPSSSKENESRKNQNECLLCFDVLNSTNKYALSCNHFFCNSCFQQYILTIFTSDGNTSIFKPCPMEGCLERLGELEFKKFLSAEKFELYKKFIINDIIGKSSDIFPCPAPSCSYVQISTQMESKQPANKNLSCKCKFEYCSQCKEIGHFPCQCEDFKKWIAKIDGESMGDENADWLFMNTKACPKCFIPIEKNQGCMHMNCKQCQYHFCWICLQQWSGHGDYYNCSRLDKSVIEQEENKKKEHTHFKFHHRSYLTHKNNIAIVEKEIEEIWSSLNELLVKLEANGQETFQISLVDKFCAQILRGRKLLPYLYAKGFFIKEKGKLEFFSSLIEDYARIIDKYNGSFENLKNVVVEVKKNGDIVLKKEFLSFMGQQISKMVGSIQTYIVEKTKQFSEGLDHFEENKTKESNVIPAKSELVYQKKREKITAKDKEKNGIACSQGSQQSQEMNPIDSQDGGTAKYNKRVNCLLIDAAAAGDVFVKKNKREIPEVALSIQINQNIVQSQESNYFSQEQNSFCSQTGMQTNALDCIDCGQQKATTEYGVCENCFDALNDQD